MPQKNPGDDESEGVLHGSARWRVGHGSFFIKYFRKFLNCWMVLMAAGRLLFGRVSPQHLLRKILH
jgi:hypothetical protein